MCSSCHPERETITSYPKNPVNLVEKTAKRLFFEGHYQAHDENDCAHDGSRFLSKAEAVLRGTEANLIGYQHQDYDGYPNQNHCNAYYFLLAHSYCLLCSTAEIAPVKYALLVSYGKFNGAGPC